MSQEINSVPTVTPDEEAAARKLAWLGHGHALAYLYGDDGEMQCSLCGVDFKRAPMHLVIGAVLDSRNDEHLYAYPGVA